MNRNILFKAKTLKDRELRIGSLIQTGCTTVIVNLGGTTLEATEVDPDTVQQLTNCYYKMRHVWEGDVFATLANPDKRYTVYYDVVFDAFRIRWSDSKTTSTAPLAAFLAEHPKMIYMGNIIDLDDNTDKP